MKRTVLRLMLVFIVGITLSGVAWADDIIWEDPATLHIGSGAGTSCATGGCPIFGSEVNGFGSTVDIYQTSAGATALDNPVLLIFGVPNDTAAGTALNSGTITSVTLLNPSPSSVPFALGGFEGLMGTGQEVYGFLGLGDGTNNSNSFTNWSAADLAVLGITAANFGIYEFTLQTSSFAGGNFLNVALSGLPLGTFAVAYGQVVTGIYGTSWSTPFTEAGVAIPEPASLMLFGTGLIALGAFIRRRRHSGV